MEVIIEITSQHYGLFAILAIISTGIMSAITFKKIQRYKRYQFHKNHALDMDINKIENAFDKILRNVGDIEKFIHTSDSIWKIDLELQSIKGIIQHQSGHLPRMRGWLK